MNKTLIFTSAIILFFGCSSQNEHFIQSENYYYQYINKYNQMEIDSIIQYNDYTIVFAWTEWCKASHNQINEYLIPFLQKNYANIGVISICCADPKKLVEFLEKNDYKYPVYLLSSWKGLDKWRLNSRFHALFDGYKSANYVPIVILTNAQKQILNLDTINGEYRGIGSTILEIKNKFN